MKNHILENHDADYIKQKKLIKIKRDPTLKIPPHNKEIEKTILGTIILENNAIDQIVDIISPKTFYEPSHQEIYNTILQLYSSGQPIDILTTVEQLRKNNNLERIGGALYISELTNNIGSSANISFHCLLLVEYQLKRKIIELSSLMQNEAYDESQDIFELLDKTGKKFFNLLETCITQKYSSIEAVAEEAIASLRNKIAGTQPGLLSGFNQLDQLIGGWQPSSLNILAARPGMGKTAFLLSTITHAIINIDKPVAIFSLETSKQDIFNRILAAQSEISINKIQRGQINDSEYLKILNAKKLLSSTKLFIDDTPSLSIFELRAKARQLKAQHQIKLIVVDYLQLMKDNDTKNLNREQEIASISRGLKAIAKELEIPIIAASQLSRAVEIRGKDKRPQLSDLRESGAIEQDADIVMFLYRPEYYGILEEDPEGNNIPGYTELKIAKHRNGPVDNIKIKYTGLYTKFEDLPLLTK